LFIAWKGCNPTELISGSWVTALSQGELLSLSQFQVEFAALPLSENGVHFC
jgi:hypothetical protein